PQLYRSKSMRPCGVRLALEALEQRQLPGSSMGALIGQAELGSPLASVQEDTRELILVIMPASTGRPSAGAGNSHADAVLSRQPFDSLYLSPSSPNNSGCASPGSSDQSLNLDSRMDLVNTLAQAILADNLPARPKTGRFGPTPSGIMFSGSSLQGG